MLHAITHGARRPGETSLHRNSGGDRLFRLGWHEPRDEPVVLFFPVSQGHNVQDRNPNCRWGADSKIPTQRFQKGHTIILLRAHVLAKRAKKSCAHREGVFRKGTNIWSPPENVSTCGQGRPQRTAPSEKKGRIKTKFNLWSGAAAAKCIL